MNWVEQTTPGMITEDMNIRQLFIISLLTGVCVPVLAECLAEGMEHPAYFDRLQERMMDWVEQTTPGMITEDMNVRQ